MKKTKNIWDQFWPAFLGAIVGGLFALLAVWINHNLENKELKKVDDQITYFHLNSVLFEITRNFDLYYDNTRILDSNQRIYQKCIDEHEKVIEDHSGRCIKDLETEEIIEVSPVSLVRPKSYYDFELHTIPDWIPPKREDSLLYGIYSIVKAYYVDVESFNRRHEEYLRDFNYIKEATSRDTISIDYQYNLLSDIAMQERLLKRKSEHIFESGQLCALLIDYYILKFYEKPHVVILSSGNKNTLTLMRDSLQISRYGLMKLDISSTDQWEGMSDEEFRQRIEDMNNAK